MCTAASWLPVGVRAPPQSASACAVVTRPLLTLTSLTCCPSNTSTRAPSGVTPKPNAAPKRAAVPTPSQATPGTAE